MNLTRKSLRLNIMVIGPPFSGKASLINTLSGYLVIEPRSTASAQHRVGPEGVMQADDVTLQSYAVDLVARDGLRVAVKIINVRNYQADVDNTNSSAKVVRYLEEMMQQSLNEEAQIKRSPKRADNRVHCCLYILRPSSRGLLEADLNALKKLSQLVNIIPVLAKSDTLTRDELQATKRRVMSDLEMHGISVLQLEEDCDPEAAMETDQIRTMLPFATISADNSDGTWSSRSYTWGKVQVENSENCDIPLLRQVLLGTHLEPLKDYTHNVLYEQFRYDVLTRQI